MEPLASVLILTYNQEQYIAQAIMSALEQKTVFPFEIIVGDDCSTDTTGKIIAEIAAKHADRIKIYRPEKNQGALKNEQHLVGMARGKYICILEGDDYWTDPLKLEKQLSFLEANPDYGMTHSDVDHFYENTGSTEFRVNRTKGIRVPEGYIFNDLISPNPFFIKTATVCFRKELVTRYFDYDRAIGEQWPLTDLALWMDITSHSKAHYFDEVFATYRLLNESVSRTASPKKKFNYHRGLYLLKKHYVEKYRCDEGVKATLEENYHRDLIRIAFNLNDKSLARQSANYLKKQDLGVTPKERLMLFTTGNWFLKSLIGFIK
jgi:glycosyltransferase involved in cell wall biosynthesis